MKTVREAYNQRSNSNKKEKEKGLPVVIEIDSSSSHKLNQSPRPEEPMEIESHLPQNTLQTAK